MAQIFIWKKPMREVSGENRRILLWAAGLPAEGIPACSFYRIINNLVLHRDDVVIMDMEAGLEHLGRGTTESMDQFIVVIEPGARSVQTYKNVKRLAKDLGVKQVRVVANKVRNEEDEAFVKGHIPQEDLLGFIHYNTEVMDADRQGKSPYDFSNTVKEEITNIKHIIEQGL